MQLRTNLTGARWAVLGPHLPGARTRGRPRRTDLRAVTDAVLYLLRSGCQWRLLPSDVPPWGAAWWCFRRWPLDGVWVRIRRALYSAARAAKGPDPEPAVAIMGSQSVRTRGKGAFGASMATSGRRGASARSWWT